MSTETKQRYTTDKNGDRWSPDGYPVGRWGIRESTWGVLRILGGIAALVGILLVLILTIGGLIEKREAERSADLREKYGVDIVVPRFDRDRPEKPWVIDGVQRNCTWDDGEPSTLTVLCLDGSGNYVEIEKK